jgi:hypothetical protein
MHLTHRFALLCLPLGLLAGSGSAGPKDTPGRSFGADLSLESVTPLATVAGAPEHYANEPVLVSGRLTDLCTKKGCWTVITDDGVTMRVRFQDYGFFLPKNALGNDALVEGVVVSRKVSAREARHIASESQGGATPPIEGPTRELGFVATGVRLLDRE